MSIGDRLLYAISARGSMSWASVKRAFDCVHEDSSELHDEESWKYLRRNAITVLENLAHVEFDARSQRIAVTSPGVAILPGRGLAIGVVVGARSPAGISDLSTAARRAGIACEIRGQLGDSDFYPSCITLIADGVPDLAAFAASHSLAFSVTPPAWSILHFAGSIDQYMELVQPEDLTNMNWGREDFDPEALFFRLGQRNDHVVLSRYTHPARRTRLHVLYEREESTRVEPDWGRFVLMRRLGHDILLYDPQELTLAAPITMPFPKLLARSLCLCSGLLPTEVGGKHWPGSQMKARVYRRIPPAIAELVAAKLQQRLVLRGYGRALTGRQT